MIEIIIQSLWLLLPAGLANMAPVMFKGIRFLDIPVDLNKKFRGKPIFGKNKTYRGLLAGIIIATLTVFIQKLLDCYTKGISLINYTEINVYLLGFLFGFGALFGDLIKSFIKRQIGINPGKPWFPFDQIDWVIGAIIFMSLYIQVSWKYILVSVLLFGLLHLIINLIGYYLGIKKNKL